MNKIEIYNNLKEFGLDVLIDESMSKHTSFKIGGNADILVKPTSMIQIKQIIDFCKKKNIKYIVIGNGTNLLVKDGGIRELVIKIGPDFNNIEIKENYITASSGTSLIALSHLAYKHGLGGLEFACGIPGTLGGAIKMNAGAFKGEMSDIVYSTKYLNENGEICEIKENQHRFAYRESIFDNNSDLIILESTLRLFEKDKTEIKERMDYCTNYRKEKQPINYPSAGSSFKRPEGHFPGQLIEECGLKGFRVGGAEVSTLHANFIINSNNATAKDVLELMEYIQKKVYDKFNVNLEPEIKVIGED